MPPDDSTRPSTLPRQAHALGDSSETVYDAGVYGLQMFAIRREQGRLAEVLPVMRMLSAQEEDQGVWRPGLTALYAELGMLDEARAASSNCSRRTVSLRCHAIRCGRRA